MLFDHLPTKHVKQGFTFRQSTPKLKRRPLKHLYSYINESNCNALIPNSACLPRLLIKNTQCVLHLTSLIPELNTIEYMNKYETGCEHMYCLLLACMNAMSTCILRKHVPGNLG